MISICRDKAGHYYVREGDLPESRKAVKRPIPITVYEMPVAFSVETKEGIMKGKKGDLLMIGVHGEPYPCDRAIFSETYDFVD